MLFTLAASIFGLTASVAAVDPAVSTAVSRWKVAVEEARLSAPPANASRSDQVRYLILLDEVARQNLWVMDDPALTFNQQQQIGSIIGPELVKVDSFTTIQLKALLPKTGWFRNRVDGKQITHGAWLIAQHSPEGSFRAYALLRMTALLKTKDVDPMDYALIFDRVNTYNHRPQRYGSQAYCLLGHYSLMPVEDEAKADILREQIGWSKTLAETKGDLEIGKPCSQ